MTITDEDLRIVSVDREVWLKEASHIGQKLFEDWFNLKLISLWLYLSRWPPYSGLIASMSSLISVINGFISGSTLVSRSIRTQHQKSFQFHLDFPWQRKSSFLALLGLFRMELVHLGHRIVQGFLQLCLIYC